MGNSRGARRRGRLLACLVLLALAGSAGAGDVVKLKGGREVEGRIVSVTAELVTLQLAQGVMKIPRGQVVAIHMRQTQVALPPPPAAEGGPVAPPSREAPGAPAGRDPEPGEEGWQPPAAPAGIPAAEAPRPEAKIPPTPAQAAAVPAPPEKPRRPDDLILGLLDRYTFLVPKATEHRISLGAAVFFLATVILYLASRLADVEGTTMGRSCTLAMIFLSLLFLETALGLTGGWPILVGVGALNVAAWFGGVRVVLGATFWRSAVMLAFACFATLLVVLWVEVMGYVLKM